MRPLNITELRQLVSAHPSPCVSLYMPTVRHHRGAEENRIRYKNLLRRAEELLGQNGRQSRDVDALMQPLRARSDEWFWNHQQSGLATFASPDLDVFYQLPISVPEQAIVGDSFNIRPLLPYLQSNRRYYLLNLNQNHVSFHRGSFEGLAPVDLRTMPKSLTDALGVPERERITTSHASAKGGGTPILHGHVDNWQSDEDLARFFRLVDHAIWEAHRDDRAPLVLAAPEKYHTPYHQISRYPSLLPEGLKGGFERARPDELHERAWPLVQQHLRQQEDRVLGRYGNLAARRLASDELDTIGRAAAAGRVQTLLLARDRAVYGEIDAITGSVTVLSGAKHGEDADLLDNLAEAVLIRGGEVYSLEAGRMPSPAPAAAIFHW